ncbi:MAG TPA: serine/threonine-protein kinase [Longimicrobiales bacterium]|nr:serine/threonine-protein kinase [Longimicrobiales bacterium]
MTDASTLELLQSALLPLQLLERLDGGGMGDIYLARDPLLRRTVAVKVLRAELARSDTDRARFFREAEAIAGISHPNVIGIHAVAELADGTPYFVMDYVLGTSIARRIEEGGPLTVRETRAVLAQVASALAAAHARGVVHRDIKPQNVLFEAETGRALVTDFGVAAFQDGALVAADGRLTQTGNWVGSPAYMSPEQFLGETITPATDVYALGMLAYDLLLGRGPFEATSPQRLLVAHVSEQPRPLRELRPDVDPELDAIVARCAQKDAATRPQASEIARMLAPGSDAVIEWPPPGLDRLRGVVYPLARLGAVAAALLLAPLLFAARSSWLLASPTVLGPVLLLVCASIGAMIGMRAGALLLRITSDVRAATRIGYRAGTLAEVMADRRGDTGRLIAGLREYAALEAAARVTLRRQRMLAAAATLAAAAALPLGILFATRLAGAQGLPSTAAITLGLAPAFLLALLALQLHDRERRLLRRHRRALHTRPDSMAVAVLVPRWYAALEQTPNVVGVPVGGTVPRPVVRLVEAAALVALLFLLLLSGSVALVLTTTAFGDSQLGTFSAPNRRYQRVAQWSDLRLPPDSSISELDAQRAFVEATADDLPWRTERPDPATIPGSALLAARPFPLDRLITIAFAGLSAAERAYLRGFTGDPGFDAIATLARAPRLAPAIGAIDSATIVFYIPFSKLGRLRAVGDHKVAEAALLVSLGRVDAAEFALRELLSAGLRLAEDGVFLIESLHGVVMAEVALRALAQLYEATGRDTEADRIRRSMQDAEDSAVETGLPAPTTRALLDMLTDTTRLRSSRLVLIPYVVIESTCTDLRGLLGGPPAEVRRALAQARAQLVRSPADSALFDASAQILERIDRYPAALLRARPVHHAVQLPARLLRSPWLNACARIVL